MSRSALPAALLMSLITATASAYETMYPLLTYACDKESDIVIVTNSLLKGDKGKDFKYSEELGTYNPWDLVTIDNSSSRPKIVASKKLVKQCELSSGTYTITLEPKTFDKYLDGRCGASISASLTITFDGIDILEQTAFEAYCHGNSPIIVRVTAHGKNSEVEIKRTPKHKFY